MKTRYVYPCVFSYSISRKNVTFYFPDFPGTDGTHKTVAKAITAANNLLAEVILQYKAEGKPLPTPSDPKNIPIYEPTDQVRFISVTKKIGKARAAPILF